MADHAWDFSTDNLSDTTLADLGKASTKWDLTRINSAGLGTLIFNGVAYSAGTFNGVNQRWVTSSVVSNLLCCPCIIECLVMRYATPAASEVIFCQRHTDLVVAGEWANWTYDASVTPKVPSIKAYYGDPIASTALARTSDITKNIGYHVCVGIGSDKKLFLAYNGTVFISTAIPDFLSLERYFSVGGLYDGSQFNAKGAVSKLNTHVGLNMTAAQLAAAAQQRYADYIAGNVTDFKLWRGL